MRHAIAWGVIALMAATNIACRKQTPAGVQAPQNSAQTYIMSDGLQITPLEVERDEISDILGIQQWRFRVVAPSPQDRLDHRIALRGPEGSSGEIVSGGNMWSADRKDREMVLALYPIGNDLTSAEKVKTYVRIDGSTTSSIKDNPFKGLGGSSKPTLAQKQDDGSFLLMEFSQSGNLPDPNGTKLVMTLKIAEPEEKRP